MSELSEQQVAAKGRELEGSRWRLPARYELQSELLALPIDELRKRDPAMASLWQRVQADEKRLKEAAAAPYGSMSPQDAYRARAAQRAEELRDVIAHLDEQIGSALVSGGADVEELQKAKIALRHRRAEFLATLGRFDLASETEPDPQYREHYLAILEAVWRSDEEHCGCPEIRGSGEHSKLTVPSWNQSEEVYSIAHGRVVTVMRCTTCGFLNATDPPTHVKEQRAHRARAQQIAGNLSPEEAARVLTAKGHTSAKLLSK